MWKTPSIFSVLVALILTRLTKADYYGYNKYRQNIAPFKCTKEGYHPDPQDCRVYYRCVDWGNGSPLTTFRFECGVGTVFSKDKGDICTHPEDSGRPECGSENAIDSNLPESPDISSPIWTTTTTQLITAQTPVTMRPSTLTTEVLTTKPEVITQPPQTSRPIADQSENNVINCQNRPQCAQEGFLEDTCDCGKFYRCVDEGYGHFRQYEFTCGVGTVWDPEIQGCNHAWAVTRQNCKQSSASGSESGNNGQWDGDIGDNGQWNGDIGSSGSPGSPGSPGTPGSPGSPGTAGSAGTPGSPGTPGTPGYPGYPGTSGTPGSPGSPGSPGTPGTPGSPGYPGTPGAPGSPGSPGSPGTPGTPGSPGIPGSPGTPGSPGAPGTPGSPGYPGTSGTSGSPGASDSSSSSDQQPTGTCTNEGFFADPKDCSKFYRCVSVGASFTKYEFKCGIGTVWDSSVESCNYAYAVPHCNQPNDGATNEPDTSLNEVDSNKPATSELPPVQSPESSSTSSQPEIQASTEIISTTRKPASSPTTSVSYLPPASSTYPSSTIQVTESASNLPSISQTTTAISYLPPSSIATTSSIPESTTGSVSYLPPDNNTPIKPASTTNPVSSTTFSPQGGKSECTEEGFFQNPDDCRKFYRCVHSQSGYIKYEFRCGPGTAWDQSIQTCNYITQVPCSTDSNEIDQSSSTSSTTSETPVTSAATTAASSQTTATTSSSAAPISTESATVASTSDETSTLESTTLEANKTESLSTTIAPASGKPEEIQMPESSSTESSSESVSSSSESSEESSSSTESHVPDCTTRKPNTTIVCNEDGFYPHPTRCDKFYRCVNNGNGFNVYHFDCPPGTIFDPSISTCNYPESVYPARDCTTGEADSVSTTSSEVSTEPTPSPETSEQPASTETDAESTTQQTEESTSASVETTTSEESITPSEESTSEIPESTESLTESTSESAIPTEVTTDSNTSEQTTEAVTEAITSAETTEAFTTESQEQSTTEAEEQSTTEAQEQSTTEAQEQSTTESQEQSTESQEPANVQDQSTTESQEQSTTESQEQSTELSESTTVKPAAAEPCAIGNLTDDQIALVCPTGFRRHPKYCNLFYQCTSEGNMEIKILVLSCPENTIFDEQKIQCLPEDKSSQSCTSTKANVRLYRRVEDNSLSPVKVSTNELCPRQGHFPYQQGATSCSNMFYKCKRDARDSLQGYMYKCPENYAYWSVSRTCERVTRLPMCSHLTYRNRTNWNNQWQIPTEKFDRSSRLLRFY